MSKAIVFDSGPIISLALNNLLWILEPLKKSYKGKFYICPMVKFELVDKPLRTKKFAFEALQVLKLIKAGVLEVYDYDQNPALKNDMQSLCDLANKSFRAYGHEIKIVHEGEMESLALALHLDADAIVIDERTTRYLIESPEKLLDRLKGKLHTQVTVNGRERDDFNKRVKHLKVIRSVELVVVAFELNLLDDFVPDTDDGKKKLLDSVLWGVKLNGAAVSKDDIREIIRSEKSLL